MQCVAEELERLIREFGYHARTIHKYMQGRDRVVKEVMRVAGEVGGLVVAVIDYERGASRVFIDKHFDLVERIEATILLGIGRRRRNLIAVIFDPDIEEGFLCKINRAICQNITYYRRVKSERACSVIAGLIGEQSAQRALRRIAESLANIIKQASPKS